VEEAGKVASHAEQEKTKHWPGLFGERFLLAIKNDCHRHGIDFLLASDRSHSMLLCTIIVQKYGVEIDRWIGSEVLMGL